MIRTTQILGVITEQTTVRLREPKNLRKLLILIDYGFQFEQDESGLKTLYLLRHAKSDWDAEYTGDHSRPLNERGIRSSQFLGQYLSNRKLTFDLAFISSSVRTAQTVAEAEKYCIFAKEKVHSDLIYGADPEDLFDLVKSQGNHYNNLAIVGHNSCLEEFATRLLFSRRPNAKFFFSKFPTCALFATDLLIENWKDLEPGKGILKLFWLPG